MISEHQEQIISGDRKRFCFAALFPALFACVPVIFMEIHNLVRFKGNMGSIKIAVQHVFGKLLDSWFKQQQENILWLWSPIQQRLYWKNKNKNVREKWQKHINSIQWCSPGGYSELSSCFRLALRWIGWPQSSWLSGGVTGEEQRAAQHWHGKERFLLSISLFINLLKASHLASSTHSCRTPLRAHTLLTSSSLHC